MINLWNRSEDHLFEEARGLTIHGRTSNALESHNGRVNDRLGRRPKLLIHARVVGDLLNESADRYLDAIRDSDGTRRKPSRNLTVIPEEYHNWSPGNIKIGLDGTPLPAKSSPPVSKRTRGAATKKK